MIPAFELHRPTSAAEVIALRLEFGIDAALLCGGTELLLIMKLGLADYPHLIDIKRVPELRGIQRDDKGLSIGSAETHRSIERSSEVQEGWPALARLERNVANVRVRNVGTLGGNLCFADPASDPATFLTACEAMVTCEGPNGRRTLPISEFTLAMYETALAEDELLTSIFVPDLPSGTGMAHHKMCLTERPAVTVSVLVRAEADEIVDARIVVGSVGGRPVRMSEAEAQLQGGQSSDLEPTRVAAAAQSAAASADPDDDPTVSAAYKRQLIEVLSGRAIQEAAKRAEGG